MYREYALNAYAVGYAANGKGFRNTAVVLRDNSTLKDLDSFLFAFLNSYVNLNGAADKNFGNFLSISAVSSLIASIIFPP